MTQIWMRFGFWAELVYRNMQGRLIRINDDNTDCNFIGQMTNFVHNIMNWYKYLDTLPNQFWATVFGYWFAFK